MRLPLPELPGPGETKGRPRCHPLQWARLPTGVRREAPDWWITRVSNAKNVYNIPEELSIDFESTIQSLPAITDRASPCAELFRPVGAQQSSTGRAHTRCGEAPVRKSQHSPSQRRKLRSGPLRRAPDRRGKLARDARRGKKIADQRH